MLALIALIPGIGAPLAAALGIFGGAAKAAGSGIANIAQAVLKNPYVLGALVASAFFLLWQYEEGDKAKLKASAKQNDVVWSAAFGQERKSFAVADKALKDQNAAVQALWVAGQSKLKASAQIAASEAPARAKAASQSATILAAPKGATDCAAAQATFEAARKALQ